MLSPRTVEERIVLSPDARLQSRGNSTTLGLASGGTVQLNEYAAAILALCDGTRSAEDIAAEMARREAPADSPREDVLEFLEAAIELRWVVPGASRAS